MLGKPGRYLLIMTFWWMAPFLLVALARFSPALWPLSYVPFLVAVAVTLLLSALCGRLEKRHGYWRRSGFGKRYFLLNGWYALNVGLILAVTLTLDYFHLVGYFNGDPEGSFGMLYLPSVLVYLVLGLILGVARQVRQARQGRAG
ncbi:MAG: hypothetical protein L6277_08250 [Desulfobacterales bacterium]|nr:hypothetical protein [Pseudomonadota bacterium]MBU4354641.1 hypothetical protein [Pseudomonadota bacterium]MCG2772064.1 hypothetical protein [Desulfobacterales bacterium]